MFIIPFYPADVCLSPRGIQHMTRQRLSPNKEQILRIFVERTVLFIVGDGRCVYSWLRVCVWVVQKATVCLSSER